jgi:hypothetical protein
MKAFSRKGGWAHMHVAQIVLNAKRKTPWGFIPIEAKVRQAEEIVVGLKHSVSFASLQIGVLSLHIFSSLEIILRCITN